MKRKHTVTNYFDRLTTTVSNEQVEQRNEGYVHWLSKRTEAALVSLLYLEVYVDFALLLTPGCNQNVFY